MRPLVPGFVLLAFCLSYGCASDEWVHRYKKPDELVYDYNNCERQMQVQQNEGARAVSITPYTMQNMIDECLQKNGWMKRTKR
jgi:hypothetical protein